MNGTKKQKRGIMSLVLIVFIFGGFLYLNQRKEKNNLYQAAINMGIEAINEDEYNQAILYFTEASSIKNNDSDSVKFIEKTTELQEVQNLYQDDHFNEALEIIYSFIDDNQTDKQLVVFVDKAVHLEEKIETILEQQAQLHSDLETATTDFSEIATNDLETGELLSFVENILANDDLHKPYNEEIKNDFEDLLLSINQQIEKEKQQTLLQEKWEAQFQYYSDQEIEYASSILTIGYPTGPDVTVSKSDDDQITLGGSAIADGFLVYKPIGNNQIEHFFADFQSRTGDDSPQFLADEGEVHDIGSVDPELLLEKLQSTTFTLQ